MGFPGNDADIALAIQAAKGTPSTVSSQRLFMLSGGIAGAKDVSDVEETSSGRLRSTAYVGQVRGEGSPSFAVRPVSIGLLLYLAMGAKAVTGASDPYTHTFTLASTLPWCTVWRRLANGLYERFSDAKVNTLSLRSEAGGILAAEVGFMMLTPAHQTAAEATATPEAAAAVFVHHDGQGALLYEGVAAAEVRRTSVAINNNLSLQQGDAVSGYDLVEQQQDITLETEHVIQNFDLYRRWMYGAASPANNAAPSRDVLELGGSGIDFKWTRPGTPERSLRIQAPRVQVQQPTGHDPNASGAPIVETRTHKVYLPGSGSGLTATLKNGQASYVAS